MEKIFVYGSLRQDFWNHDKVLKNRVRHIQNGTIKGKLYHLPAGYPAVIKGTDEVHGEVMTINQDKLLRSLDFLEGYFGEGEDNLYIRTKHKTILDDGTEEWCWVYTYANEEEAKKKGKYISSGDWNKFVK